MYMCDPSPATADFTPSTVIFNTYGREKQVRIAQRRYALHATVRMCAAHNLPNVTVVYRLAC